MTGRPNQARDFLGRPETAYPGYVPRVSDGPGDEAAPKDRGRIQAEPTTRSRASRLWLAQAITGGLLVVFLGIHLVAQHLLVPEGLRDYGSVVSYLSHPLALAAEIGLLASVVAHACLGLRASLVEIVSDGRALRWLSIGIAVAGLVAIGYAAWLTWSVIGTPAG